MTKVVGALLAGFVLASVLSVAWLVGPNSETTRANPDFSIGVDKRRWEHRDLPQ
jgi:hypothetical protein